jgi:hypothetical protein
MNKKIFGLAIFTVFLLSFISMIPLNNAQVVGSGSINSGLIVYYRFDESSGTSISDSSGNNYITTVNSGLWQNGFYGNSLNFDGSNTYIRNLNSNINVFSSDFSLFLRFKTSNINVSYASLFSGASTINQYNQQITLGTDNNLGRIRLFVRNDSGGSNSVGCHTPYLNNNIWYNIGIVHTGSLFILYLNGYQVSNVSFSNLGTLTLNSLSIGEIYRNLGAEGRFLGNIDDFRVYNRALSTSEILTLYQGFPITISNDVGSTVSPNSTVFVGVDQSLLISVNALPNYVSWSQYFDNQIVSPSSTYLLNNVESSHTFYVTSQYIGGNSQIINNNNNFDYNYIIFVVLFLVSVILCIKRIPILGLSLGFFTIILSGLVFMNDINIGKYFTYLLILVSFSCMVINGLDVRRKK